MGFWALLGSIGKGAVAAGKGLAGAPQAAGGAGTISTASQIGHSIGSGLRYAKQIERIADRNPSLSDVGELYGATAGLKGLFHPKAEPKSGLGNKYGRLSMQPNMLSPSSPLGKTNDPRFLLEQMDKFNIDWPD